MGGGTAATVAPPSSSQAAAAAALPSTPPASSTSSEASGSDKTAAQHGTPPPAGLVEPKRAASASQQSQSDAAAAPSAAASQDSGAAAPSLQNKAGEAAVPMVLSSSGDDDDLYGQPPQQQQPEQLTKPPAQGPCRFDGCGKDSPYRCLQCGDAFYCSRAHQRGDWTWRLPDGTKGGHHTECVPRQWLPAVPAEALPHLPPVPPAPPKQQQDGGETIWSCSGGEVGGNAAKRLRVGDDLFSGGGGGGEDKSNPQASMWSSSGADPSAMLTPAYWREGGSGPGPGTQPLGGLEGSGGGGSLSSLVPIAPMAGYDEEFRDVVPAIHPAGFEGADGVGMAAGEEGRVVAGASAIIDLAGEDSAPMMTAGPPPEGALMQLMEMGFEEGEVRSALLVKANDVQRACEYLLGGSAGGGGSGGGGAIEAAGSMDFDSTAAEQAAVGLVGISDGGWSTPRAP